MLGLICWSPSCLHFITAARMANPSATSGEFTRRSVCWKVNFSPFNKSHSIKSPSSDSSMFASSFVVDFYPPYISFSFFTLKSLFVRVESPAIQIHHVHSFSSFPIPKSVPKKHVMPCRNQQKCTKKRNSPIRNTSSLSALAL